MDLYQLTLAARPRRLAGYLIGSIPFGLLVGKLFHGIDVRDYGSGNIGTANTYRILGFRAGSLVLVCDTAKGFVPAFVASLLLPPWLTVLVAVTPVIGHMRSIFLGFTGGKGVATASGIILALMWPIFVIVYALWLALIVVTRYVSIASIVAADQLRRPHVRLRRADRLPGVGRRRERGRDLGAPRATWDAC